MAAKKSAKTAKQRSAPSAEPPKGGRPTLYRPEFCQDIVEHMKLGNSVESFGAYLGTKYGARYAVHRDTIYAWENAHQEFSDAINGGRAYSLKFYEDLAKSGMSGNLRRLKSETPILGPDGKPVLAPDGTLVTKKEYEPATFNASSWIFTMKNRFNWRDRLEHSGEVKNGASVGDALVSIFKDPKLAAAAKQIAEKLVEGEGA
jgi:hypothetical protein